MVFFLFALGPGLLSPERRVLLRREAVLGLGVMLLTVLPYLLWQVHHGWPTLEFLRNGRSAGKNLRLAPVPFLLNQIFVLGPWTAFVWVPGLVRALRRRDLRWIGVTCVVFILLMMAMGAKDYYVTPVYPVLFAVGGIAWESRFRLRTRVQRGDAVAFPAAFATAVILGVLFLPLSQPVLRPETFLRYRRALHLPSTNSERMSSGDLPQFYADRFGWQEMVDQVQRVVDAMPAEERRRAAIVCDDYGEAGALEFLGRDLPPVLSGHNNY